MALKIIKLLLISNSGVEVPAAVATGPGVKKYKEVK